LLEASPIKRVLLRYADRSSSIKAGSDSGSSENLETSHALRSLTGGEEFFVPMNGREAMNDRLRSVLSLWLGIVATLSAVTAVAQPVVVELFTSQGCSSCPPADALLGELARQPNIVALAYHVDYWDELGWKDRFSIPEAVRRQRGYVGRLSRSGAFTPQAVVSGDTSLVGSNRAAMKQALAADRDALAISLSKAGENLSIDLPERWSEPMEVHVISYLAEATTKVGRGENAHRSLKEFNIVRSFKRLGTWDGKPQELSVPLAAFPADATSVAVLLQRPGQGAIAGAATLSLH
jgi:hypothetical protein